MRAVILSIILFSSSTPAWSQATITGTGDWSNPLIWSAGNIGDVVTEDVTLNNNQDVTVQPLSTYTIGNFTSGNSTALTIVSNAVLNVGDAANSRDFTVNNGLNLTVGGVLHIHGDLIVNNNITISVTGVLIIDGDVIMNNGSSLSVTSGSFSVGGNFTGGNNTSISLTLPGTLDVAGDLNVGTGSTLGGNGILSVGGACAGPICTDSQLPVTLIFFNVSVTNGLVVLNWATASELNFDYFSVEKSVDGILFSEIGRVQGHGTTSIQHSYTFADNNATIGKLYYRLKSVDFDGYSEYFSIEKVEYSDQKSFMIYPNPVTGDRLNLRMNFRSDQLVIIQATDITGSQVLKYVTSPINEFFIPISLRPGAYVFSIKSGNHAESKRIVVK